MTHEKSDATPPQPGGGVGIAQLKNGTWEIKAADGVLVGWVVVEGYPSNAVEHWFYNELWLPLGKPVSLTFSAQPGYDAVKAEAKKRGFFYVKATCSLPEKLA
jgi:hypothetical protein